MATRPLTPKQERFVQEYLVDLNATQAAERAGYSARTARQTGAENLTKPDIAAAVQSAMRERSARTQITADEVLAEIAALAFSDLGQILDFTGDDPRLRPAEDIPEAARRAVASIKVRRVVEAGAGEGKREVEVTEFKLWDKLAALEKAARHLGLFAPDRHEHSGPGGGPIPHEPVVTLTDDQRAAAIAAILARVGGPGRGPDRGGPGDPGGLALGGPGPGDDPGRDDPGPVAEGGA